jgi:beta-glucosidase-like glycosyl hydrolase
MDINELSDVEKIGQMLFPAAYIHDDEAGIEEVTQWIKGHHIGGLVFFHSRVSAATSFEAEQKIKTYDNTLEKLKYLVEYYQSMSKYPLMMCIDAEFGLAMRIENTTSYPYAITLGCLEEPSEAIVFNVAKSIAKDMKSVGLHMNFAPVADINSNLANPVIGYRSFGQDKHSVAQKSLSFYNGMLSENILGCVKHFPGHGDTAVDSHLSIPTINKSLKELEEEELYPFKYAFEKGVEAVMIGHLAVPALSGDDTLPATLSSKIIKDLLRNEWGYNGLIITDALNMRGVCNLFDEKGKLEEEAFRAGNDILLVPVDIREAVKKIKETQSSEQWHESAERIIKAKEFVAALKTDIVPENNTVEAPLSAIFFELVAGKTLINYHQGKNLAYRGANMLMLNISENKNEYFPNQIGIEYFCQCKHLKPDSDPHFFKQTSELSGINTIIIALFIPHLKTKKQFGLSNKVIEFINSLATQVHCELYVFGNPLAVQLLVNKNLFVKIILIPQKEKEFQVEACAHFLNNKKALGQLPFRI